MMKSSPSAVFSLVDTESIFDDDEVLEEMVRTKDSGAKLYDSRFGSCTDLVNQFGYHDGGDDDDDDDEYEESEEDSHPSDYAENDDDEDMDHTDENDLVDAGLAAAQDSVKTVITQSFRACAYAADSVASLVLKAHDYKNDDSGAAASAAAAAGSSTRKLPLLVDDHQTAGHSSSEDMEKLKQQQQAFREQRLGRLDGLVDVPLDDGETNTNLDDHSNNNENSSSNNKENNLLGRVLIPERPNILTTSKQRTSSSDDHTCTEDDVVGELPNEHSAIEREELRLRNRQIASRLPKNVSSEAFSQLFNELDDSTYSLYSGGNSRTPPNRLPSDFQLSFLPSSSASGSETDGIMFDEDAVPTDDDAYTETDGSTVGYNGAAFHADFMGIESPRHHRQQEGGFIPVAVRAISHKLKQPILFVGSLFFPNSMQAHGNGSNANGLDTSHPHDWDIPTPSSPMFPYYFTPPVTPFDRNHQHPSLRGFRSSLRKVSLGSFNSLKDAISSWRNSRKMISSTHNVPNYAAQQSGLFEDIEMFLLERVDLTFYAARNLARKIKKDGKRYRPTLLSTTSSSNTDLASHDDSHDATRNASGYANDPRHGYHHHHHHNGSDNNKLARRHKATSKTPAARRKKTRYSILRFIRDMVTLRIPRSLFSKARRGASSLLMQPFSFLESASHRFVHLEKVDELEGVGDIVRRQGYPYEELFVCTRDGYILRLERLPNHGSKKVLYMQHGVMDSSFTWVANGADNSLAFRAHDAGYDVFLGNFRGAGGEGAKRHVRPDITNDEYWDFSINEHAFEDIPAFVNAIVRTKITELSQTSEGATGGVPVSGSSKKDIMPNIVAVAHSMGGAAMLMYLLNQRQKRKKHFLDGMLLVSPAGIHVESPLYARLGGRLVDLTVAKLVNSLRLPTDALTRAAVKLVQDVKNSVPALEDIISLVVVYSLGGDKNNPRRGPFSAVQQVTYNVLTCGTSTKVFTHLRQFITTKKFQAFDYEPTAYPRHFNSKKGGNMEAYGTPTPPVYTDMYHKIDIPVHLIAGLDDKLIGPMNILRHYNIMREQGIDVTFESFEHCGHADFTCGLNSKVLRGFMEAIEKVTNKSLMKKQAMQELQRKKLITAHVKNHL